MKLLIAGIDPGTTVGYALIDLNGRLVDIGSEKHLDLNALIAKVVKIGKVLVVGTDKAKLPGFVDRFANALGSRVVKPDSDLGSKDKQGLVKGYEADDDHQFDALAAAIFSLKKLRGLFTKIESYVENYKKHKIADKLTSLVVLKGMSIKEASDLLEKPDKEESRIIAKVIEERKFEEKDFLKLYSKLKQIEKENSLLRQQNKKIKDEIINLEKPREKKKPYEKKFNELLKFREKRLFILERELSSKETDIEVLKSEMNKLCYFLSTLNKNILLKKLDNLGNIEFEKKETLLNIGKGDVLLVDDPNIISEKTMAKIKNKVSIIIYNKKPGKKVAELPFFFINSKKLDIKEDRYFAVLSREEFEEEKKKLDVLNKLIHDYKKERSG
jgi:predicted RNase H-like nuclease (RuvC/YqgF family)